MSEIKKAFVFNEDHYIDPQYPNLVFDMRTKLMNMDKVECEVLSIEDDETEE